MTIGLAFDEFVNVKLRPTNEDVPKHRSADVRAAQLVPMTTTEAANRFRSRGCGSPINSLEELAEDGVVSLDADGKWTREPSIPNHCLATHLSPILRRSQE